MKFVSRFIICILSAISPFCAESTSIDLSSLDTTAYEEVVSTSDVTPKMILQLKKYNIFHENIIVRSVLGRKAVQEGERQRANFLIEDPASEIARQLGAFVGAHLNLPATYIDSSLPMLEKNQNNKIRSATELKEKFGERKIVINAATRQWAFSAFAKTKFRSIYSGTLSIVDTNTGKTIGYYSCVSPMNKADKARDAGSILVNDAAGLKAEIKDSVDFCVGSFKDKLLRKL